MELHSPGVGETGPSSRVQDLESPTDGVAHQRERSFHVADLQTMNLARPNLSFGRRNPQRRASGGPMTAILRDRPNWQHRESSGVTSFMEDFNATRQVIPGRGTRRASIRVTDSFRKASTTEDHEKAEQEEEEDGGSDSGDSMDFLSADDVRSCVTEDAYIKTIRSTAVTTAPFGLSQELARTYIDGRAGVTAGGGGAATRRLADTSRAAVDGDAVAGEVDEVPLSQYGMLPMGEYKAHFIQVKQVIVLGMPPREVRFASLDRSCIRVWKACGVTESLYEFPAASPGFVSAIEARKDKQLLLAATMNSCLKVMAYSLHETATLRTHKRPFLRMVYDEGGGRLLTAGMDGMHLWNFQVAIQPGLDRTVTYELALLRVFPDSDHLFNREILPLADFRQVACQGENVIEVFNVSDGSRASSLWYDEVARLTAFAYLPGIDSFATGDFFGTLAIWTKAPSQEREKGCRSPVQRLSTYESVATSAPSVAFESPPSAPATAPSYLKVHSVRVHHGNRSSILSICRHPQPDCLLTSGADGLIKTVSLESYEVLHVITAAKDPLPLLKVGLHPDLSLCLCGTSRGLLRLWAFEAASQRFACFIKPVQRIRYFARPKPRRVRGRGGITEAGQPSGGHVVVWTEAGDVQRLTADGQQTRTLPGRLALMEVCQYDYSPTSEVLFCLCKNGDIIALSMKTNPPTQVGAWVRPEKTHEGRIERLHFFHLHPPSPSSTCSRSGRWETLIPASTLRATQRPTAGRFAHTSRQPAAPEETLVVGTAGGYLGLRDALGDGHLYRTAATGVDGFLDMRVAEELSVLHVLAERGGEVVGLSWSLPSLTPGYCIQTAARPSLMEVSQSEPVLMYGFSDGHVLLFDTSQHDEPRLLDRRRGSQAEHMCGVTDVAFHDGIRAFATVDSDSHLHFWSYDHQLLAALRLKVRVTSIAFLKTGGGGMDLLVASGREVMVVPSHVWYPPHRRLQTGDFLVERIVEQGLRRVRKSHAWARALNTQPRYIWSLASNRQQQVRVRIKEEDEAAAAAEALMRSEDPHDALAKQVRDMKEAVVLNNGKVEQLVSRLRPLVLEGGVDEADYDLLENRNLGNTVNQAEEVLEVRLAKAYIGKQYNNAKRRQDPAPRKEAGHRWKEPLPRKPEPPAPSALSDKQRRQRRGLIRLHSAVRVLRAATDGDKKSRMKGVVRGLLDRASSVGV